MTQLWPGWREKRKNIDYFAKKRINNENSEGK